MHFNSQNPFNFEIPEEKSTSLILRFTFFLFGIFFQIVPLYSINNHVFKTNEVTIILDCDHDFCKTDSGCLLISY